MCNFNRWDITKQNGLFMFFAPFSRAALRKEREREKMAKEGSRVLSSVPHFRGRAIVDPIQFDDRASARNRKLIDII